MQFSTLKEKKSAEHIFCILYFTNVKKIISDPSVSSTHIECQKIEPQILMIPLYIKLFVCKCSQRTQV